MNAPTWTDILQTIAIVAALCFTAWETRARTRAQRHQNYLDAISRSVDVAKLMVENRDLHTIYEYSTVDWDKTSYVQLSDEERAMVHYCDLIIALCETVWLAAEEGLVSKDEWPYWKRWAHQLNQSPAFRWTLNWVSDDYDSDFMSEIRCQNPLIA